MYTWWKKLDKNTKKELLQIGAASAAGAFIAIVTYEKVMDMRGYKMVIPIKLENEDVFSFMDRKGNVWGTRTNK